MSEKSTNLSSTGRSPFESARPERIKAALDPKAPVSNRKYTQNADNRVKLSNGKKKVNPYTENKAAPIGSQINRNKTLGALQNKQRTQLGNGPTRKASDSLSEILARQKTENSAKVKVEQFNNLSGSANDDIAHAAQLLEEIKSDSSKKPVLAALGFTILWTLLCVVVALSLFNSGMVDMNVLSLASLPTMVAFAAVLFIPCILSWGVAVFLWRARELHQISLSLAYTALHLTQPEDMASESIATIGQAVRREVAAMGDGIDRAISRATTLESKFRHEVGNIQGFYKNYENIFHKIIHELEKERDLMSATGDDLEARLPKILDSLKESSFDFTKIVQSADQRFSSLASTADNRLTDLSQNIEEKTQNLRLGFENTVKDVVHMGSLIDAGTNKLSVASDKLSNVGNTTTSKLESISGNFKRQSADLGFATQAILKANEEINVALHSRHESLSGSAEKLLQNAEQINNLLSSFASVIDKSFLNAEDRSRNMQEMLRDAAQDSADILQTEMTNIRKSTSSETQKLIELLRESSFTATTALRDDIQAIIGGSQDEVRDALRLLLKESHDMSEILKVEANAITQMMHKEMQGIKESAVDNTEESLEKIRNSHEAAIADIIVRIDQAGERLSGTADNLNFITGRMDEEMEGTRKHLIDQVSKLPLEAKQALHDLQSYVDDQVGALSELAKTVGGFGLTVSTPESAKTWQDNANVAPTNKAVAPTRKARTARDTSRDGDAAWQAPTQRQSARREAPRREEPRREEPRREEPRREEPRRDEPRRDEPRRENRQVSASPYKTEKADLRTQKRAPTNRNPERRQTVSQQQRAEPAAARRNTRPARSTANVATTEPRSSNKWEMPDLLSRASSSQGLPEHLQPRSATRQAASSRREEVLRQSDRREVRGRPAQAQPRGQAPARATDELHSVESLNAISLDLAKALDHEAPDELWARYRNGERNVFTRRLYTLRGQKLFDEVSYKYRNDAGFRRDVDRYIADFEDLLTKIYEQDRDSMLIDTYLSSETGKIYLMLAHASGRLD